MVLIIGLPHKSVFDKLPVELITKILLLCVFHEDKTSDPQYFEPYQRRHLLSKVCHAWDDAIERCPFFWAKIEMKDLENVPHALRQSGTLIPLKIDCGANPIPEDLEQFLDLVLPHSHRWYSLHMHTECPDHALRALKAIPVGLKSLHVDFESDNRRLSIPRTVPLAGIQDLKLISVKHVTGLSDLANLTSLQLRTIDGAGFSSITMTNILRASPNLQLLEMFQVQTQEIEDANLPAQGDSTIVLPELRHLCLDELLESFMHQVLGSIHAENLRFLHASRHGNYEYSQLGRNILHHLLADGNPMVANVIRNNRNMDDSKEDSQSDIAISSLAWPISITSEGKSSVLVQLVNTSWLQEPLHPRDLLVFRDLDVILDVHMPVGIYDLLRDGFPFFDYFPSLVTLILHEGPEETIGIFDHITNIVNNAEVYWAFPKLAWVQVGNRNKAADRELQSCVARFVAAFSNSAKGPNCVVPKVTLVGCGKIRHEWSHGSNTFVLVKDETRVWE